MNIYVKRALQTAVCAAGLWGIGNAVASAETVPPPAIQVPITAPVTVAGNSIAVLDGLPPIASVNLNAEASVNVRIAVANLVNVPVNVPVVIKNNPVTLGSAPAAPAATAGPAAGSGDPATGTTPGSGSSGTLVNAPITAPVLVCGNAVGVLADTAASCGAPTEPASASGAGATSQGSATAPSAVDAPVTVPVLVCGNGVGVLGNALAACSGAAAGTRPASAPAGQTDGGTTLLDVPVTVPVNVCGTGIGLLGDASASCGVGSTVTSVSSLPGQSITPGQPTMVDVLRSTSGNSAGLAALSGTSTSLAFTGVDSSELIALAVGLLIGGGLLAGAGVARRRPAMTELQD